MKENTSLHLVKYYAILQKSNINAEISGSLPPDGSYPWFQPIKFGLSAENICQKRENGIQK